MNYSTVRAELSVHIRIKQKTSSPSHMLLKINPFVCSCVGETPRNFKYRVRIGLLTQVHIFQII